MEIAVFNWLEGNKEELLRHKGAKITGSYALKEGFTRELKLTEEHFKTLDKFKNSADDKKYNLITNLTLDKPLKTQIWGQINNILAHLNDLGYYINTEKHTDTDDIFELFHVAQDYYSKNILEKEKG